jgi:U3 small nucleolar RNA-associated protein 4
MDIHRCRFVPYPPHPVNALAFSHTSDPKRKSPSDLRLAVGRNNGDLEIWNPLNGNWSQETILKGTSNTIIEQIAWTQEVISPTESGPLRLFSTGGSSLVLEWDLNTGVPKRQVEGHFGDIWCFASQPQEKSPADNAVTSQLLAAGCNNGTIVLFTTADDDLRYAQALPAPATKKPRVLSLTWRDRNTIVAGYDDSMIRVIDVPTRTIIRHMSLGRPVDNLDNNDSVVWAVKCLPNGTIISGDSSGELKIWDSHTYSLLQRLKTHDADILEITNNAAGDMIFSLGVDRRTVSYKPIDMSAPRKTTSWAAVSHRRYHRHDVKCATTFESTDMSVLVSGGMDATPIVTPIRRSQSEKHLTLSHLPQKPQISSSTSSRLFISWWDRVIAVYHISQRRSSPQNLFGSEALEADEPAYEPLTRVVLNGDKTIQDAQLASDGQFMIAATSDHVKLFQLRKTTVSGRQAIRTRQVELPSSIVRLGGRLAGFTPDGKWLYIVRNDNTVVLAKIVLSSNPREPPTIHTKNTKLYRASRSRSQTALGEFQQTITHVSFSSDSRILAVGDLSGAIDTWVLEGHEDLDFIETTPSSGDAASDSSSDTSSDDDEDEDIAPVVHGQKWIRNPSGSNLPKLDSAILALTFRPALHIAPSQSSNNNLGLHATRQNPHPVSHEFPTTDAKLIALTASHQLIEFDVMSSRLSDWTRRNPSRYLPYSFTRLKARVTGCFWDVTDRANRGERLWLYSHNYLCMFDMSRDLARNEAQEAPKDRDAKGEKRTTLGKYQVLEPIENGVQQSPEKSKHNKKRQNLLEDTVFQGTPGNKKRRRHRQAHNSTGAGDQMIPAERPSGLGNDVRKFKNDGGDEEMVDIDTVMEENDDDDNDMEEMESDDVLATMRRGDDKAEIEAKKRTAEGDEGHAAKPSGIPRHYLTTAYNSILGIAVIGPDAVTSGPTAVAANDDAASLTQQPESNAVSSGSGNSTSKNQLEIVIVERSMFDVDQMPRFDGLQNWDT